jgi:hypothetical protein
MVIEVGKLLDAAGIAWWLDYGTLLGAVRSGGIISYDKDADCGFWWQDASRFRALVRGWARNPVNPGRPAGALQAGVAGELYVIEKQTSHPREIYSGGNSFKVHWSARNRTCVDLFGWGLEDGIVSRERYHIVDRYKGREFPEERLLPLGQIRWEGVLLPCPADPEWFCAHRYGPNWKTPKRQNNEGVKR